ncbi:Magnesium transport protein CorA [Mycobacterium basiliense]|uniref:Magnesium transport protein CorA n=1 Tax=Mycobacterium basiliense TaxID=2094119 RepID=A0A3S4FT11_9MYCO|nr:magnesium/cobalt transporter CorA [Mycobacterium basiliense]VDM90069.1 Magnesium transport protein CorA [Mycobacterium basiliense]
MFQGFDALPESLRTVARTRPQPPDSAPTPPAPTLVDCGVYVEGRRMPGKYEYADALSEVREIELAGREAFVWIGLHEPDEKQMQDVADVFGLHPLAVEDAVHAHQRPKLERYDETLFLVLKTVNYVPHESVVLAREIVETGEIMIFVGKDFVVTVRHGEHGGLSEVRKRMDADPEHLQLGPYAVMHAIADYVVDHYLSVTSLMETDIDSIEEVAFEPGRRLDVEPIYLLKREVVELRRCVHPLSIAFQRMQTENKDLISKELRRYLRDVADHQTEAAEQVSSYDEMLNSLVQAALARVGMQQNMDMRKISAYAGIIAVPTMIAGIYGMNFHFMPELDAWWGYPAVVGTMLLICVFLYRSFRSRNWL